MDIRPLGSVIGAEIQGVDLTKTLAADVWQAIHQAFHDYLVIFFRDQALTPEQHITFSRRFGVLEPYPFVHGIEGHPEIIEIVKMPDETRTFGSSWHADMSFRETPPLGAVLHALEVPPAGGDTVFANMYAAYDTLSPGLQALLGTLQGRHDSLDPADHSERYKGMRLQGKEGTRRVVQSQPLVRAHPVTGRRTLFLSPSYMTSFEDMTELESAPLLNMLERHATREEFTCRFHWEPHSVAVWDNRCTMHRVLSDDMAARFRGQGFKRRMRRTTIRT